MRLCSSYMEFIYLYDFEVAPISVAAIFYAFMKEVTAYQKTEKV